MGELEGRATSAYRRRWNAEPERVLRTPGRINVIGDHTDYSLLPVLPMAIQHGIAFAVGRGESGVVIDSLNEPGPLTVWGDGRVSAEQAASWHRYAEIAVGFLNERPDGVRIILVGDLPSTGGLSSSSALVVGLLAAVSGFGPTPLRGQELVDAAVGAERMAAIEGGAMDQTIIVFGTEGAAVRLEFDPPARRVIAIPEELAFIAAYSGQQAAKGASAKDSYNTRVVACRSATALLSRIVGCDVPDPLVLGRLGPVPAAAVDELPLTASAVEVARTSGVDLRDLIGMAAVDFDPGRPVPIRVCARHVIDEASAVDAMEVALGSADLDAVGRLLDRSHRSLRSFGSSTPALDSLTSAMVAAGALGARVTGAGFGGYAIAACRADRLPPIIAAALTATGGPAFPVTPSNGITGL